jgi:hypothetical protein
MQFTAIRNFAHGEVEPISTIDLSVYEAVADDVPFHIYDSRAAAFLRKTFSGYNANTLVGVYMPHT